MKTNQSLHVVSRLFLFAFLCSQSLIAQVVNIDMEGGNVNQTLDPYYIGQTYNVSIHPQNIDGDMTWEVLNALSPSSGLKMQVDGTDLTGITTVTPDGTAEDVVFVDNMVTPVENQLGYQIQLNATDDSHEVLVTLFLPVLRAPVSVAMVLDRSGSMGWFPSGATGPDTRMDILQTAATLFVNKLEIFNQTDDEMVLVYFESDVNMPPPGIAGTPVPINGNVAAINTDINSLSTGGSTSMGEGLIEGKNQLGSALADNRKFIFLFTDGEQNTGRLVNNAGTEVDRGESLNDMDNSIQIIAIGTGAAAVGAPATLLQNIAQSNQGTGTAPYYFLLTETVDPNGVGADFNTLISISDFFNEGFEAMLRGNSPQTVNSYIGRHNWSNEYEEKQFEINKNVSKLIFEIIADSSYITIWKGSTQVSNAVMRFGPKSLLATIDFPQDGSSPITPEGVWTLRYSVYSKTGNYQVKAIVDDHKLKYNVEPDKGTYKVGEPVVINAKVNYDGTPLEGAEITTLIMKPGEDIGHILATANADFDPSSSQESGSVGYQKLLALIQQNPNLIDSLGLQENVLNLTHTGNGEYTGSFNGSDVTGVYHLHIMLEDSTEQSGKIVRKLIRSIYFRFPHPDPDESEQVHNVINDSTVVIKYTPKYRFSNEVRFVGPAWAGAFVIKGNEISPEQIQDMGNGTYSITLVGNINSKINIELADSDIYEGSAKGPNHGFCNWIETTFNIPCWLGIIILVVILIIIIIIRRRSGNN